VSQRRGGFTLIELIVVLAVLAVTTGLAVPAFRKWVEEDDITTATRQIESLFRIARDSAIRSGVAMTVAIDSATSRVWLIPAVDDSVATMQNDTAALGEVLALPQTVSLQLSKLRAHFRFAAGGAVFGDSLWIETPYERRLITLNPWTGDVIEQP